MGTHVRIKDFKILKIKKLIKLIKKIKKNEKLSSFAKIQYDLKLDLRLNFPISSNKAKYRLSLILCQF